MTRRERVYHLITPEAGDTGVDRAVNICLAALIVLNAVALALETVEPIGRAWRPYFLAFEILSVAIFTVEYLVRLWTAPVDPSHAGKRFPVLRHIVSPLAVIDLLAILPSLLALTMVDLRFARTLRLIRLMRAFKIARYSPALLTLGRVLRSRRAELGVATMTAAILVVCAASLLYFAENEAQPAAFPSIPGSMWWAVTTLTTVGYGDVYPVTPIGRVLASFIAVMGIGMFALPAAILSSGFVEELRAGTKKTCPHCGNDLE